MFTLGSDEVQRKYYFRLRSNIKEPSQPFFSFTSVQKVTLNVFICFWRAGTYLPRVSEGLVAVLARVLSVFVLQLMTPFMASKPIFIAKRDAADTTHKPRLITVVQHLKQKKYTNLKHVFQHLRRTEYTMALKTTKVGSSIVVVTPEFWRDGPRWEIATDAIVLLPPANEVARR